MAPRKEEILIYEVLRGIYEQLSPNLQFTGSQNIDGLNSPIDWHEKKNMLDSLG